MELTVESRVRGLHVYKDTWTPSVGEELPCKRETGNDKDRYAVAVMRGDTIVGHVPRKISAACSLFLRRNGTIRCTVTGSRRFSADLPQGGLEVPCELKFKGEPNDVAKVRKLLTVGSSTTPNAETTEIEQPKKKIKMEPDLISVEDVVIKNGNCSTTWLSFNHIKLTEADRDIVTMGEQLTDKHINFAQFILKKQFVKLLGLQSTVLLSNLKAPLPAVGALQIVHSRGNHWIVASTVGCSAGEVMVFDSLYSSIDQLTLELLLKLFGPDTKVKLEMSPQQYGGKDCGVFAIAMCTSLAYGHRPSCIAYDQSTMRCHLVRCYEKLCFAPFPSM